MDDARCVRADLDGISAVLVYFPPKTHQIPPKLVKNPAKPTKIYQNPAKTHRVRIRLI